MSRNAQTAPLFRLDVEFKDPLRNRLLSLVKGPIEHALAFPRMNRAYADISRMAFAFCEKQEVTWHRHS